MLDPKLLSHTLNNLINNAFKYSISKDNPQLRLQFEETEGDHFYYRLWGWYS